MYEPGMEEDHRLSEQVQWIIESDWLLQRPCHYRLPTNPAAVYWRQFCVDPQFNSIQTFTQISFHDRH